LCDFGGDDDISLPSFTYTSSYDTSISMEFLEDALIIPNLLTLIVVLGKLKNTEEFESDVGVYDPDCDEWYDCNDDDEECLFEENPLGGSYGMLVHEVSPPCLELVEYTSLNPLDLVPMSLTPLSIILLGSWTVI